MNVERLKISSEYHPKGPKLLSWSLNGLKSITNTNQGHQNLFNGPCIAQNRFQIPPQDFNITFMYLELLKIDSNTTLKSSILLSWSLNGSKSILNTSPRLQNYFDGTWLSQDRFQIPSRLFKIPFIALELLKIDFIYHPDTFKLLSWTFNVTISLLNTTLRLQN